MNKMGFNEKMNGEGILYGILVIGLLFFVLNMSEIYQFVSKFKTGQLFEKEKEPEVEKPSGSDKEEEDAYTIVTPIGKSYGVCSKTITENGGDRMLTVKLYHTDNKLKSIVEEIEYSGISDEYMNYIYSENSKYKERQKNNLKLTGFSVVPKLSSSTSLTVSSVVDLSQVEISKIKLESEDKLDIAGKYNQDTVELTNEYVSLGYECEW